LAQGKSSKELAVALNISVKTAETPPRQYHAPARLPFGTELVRYAMRNHIIEA
jgi:DNA-binding NarL/FixJ family response regulator